MAEAISEARTEVDVALTFLAAAEESLGDPLEALREALEEAQEVPGEDPAVLQETPEPLVWCQVVLGTRTGF